MRHALVGRAVLLLSGMGWQAREFFTALPDAADHPVFRVDPC